MRKLTMVALMISATSLLAVTPQKSAWFDTRPVTSAAASDDDPDKELASVLKRAGFTGTMEQTLPARLGRPLDMQLADLGRLIYFDNINGLHDDNSCAGCHSPAFGFGDSQSIAIGVQNNRIVGPNRAGPRNQRKAPPVIDSAFFPKQMLNGRFSSNSGDPFDNSLGFHFPPPEDDTKFPPNDPNIKTLLAAQGHIPQTELVEMAGFTGTKGTISPEFDQFDDGNGFNVPLPDSSGFRNDPIRAQVLEHFNSTPEYLRLFGRIFDGGRRFKKGEITFAMVGQAIAEFQTSLTFTDSPLDRFARGEKKAMTAQQKRGALLFFGKAKCVTCHAVAGESNEMFSDFENHVVGVPQIAPHFGVGKGNIIFDGPGRNEDFGAEQISTDPKDRYKFRSSPLRNVGVQPAFFHNGAFTRLEDAVLFHLNAKDLAPLYNPVLAGVNADLANIENMGPINAVLKRLDPKLKSATQLIEGEFSDLIAFLREGILDPRAKPENLCALVPKSVPSGKPVARFEGCRK